MALRRLGPCAAGALFRCPAQQLLPVRALAAAVTGRLASWLPTRSSSQSAPKDEALTFCVVGSGPAGFYTADRLLKQFGDAVKVDIVDRLATPFGLVRSGVAPDHQDTKNVVNQFGGIARDPRVSLFGNVTVGRDADVSLPELRSLYNGVVLAYGAEGDRRLGVPGEHLRGVFSARELVWWYNGHPDYVGLPVGLEKTSAVAIAGIGNVAIDCARVLLRNVDELATTDIADHALEALRTSAVRDVHMIIRRGPAQAACTPKELRELLGLEGVQVKVHPEGVLVPDEADVAEMKASRRSKRVVDLLTKAAGTASAASPSDARTLHFHFLRSPTELKSQQSDDGRVSQVVLETNELVPAEGGGRRAKGTGELSTVAAQLVLESIGYRSLAMDGAPYDDRAGVIPNSVGRVWSAAGSPEATVPGLFVSGWVKRGPTGIIGSNIMCAEQTVASIADDAKAGILPNPSVVGGPVGSEGLQALLSARGVAAVGVKGWEAIDSRERAAGEAQGRPRVKIVSTDEMVAVARAA